MENLNTAFEEGKTTEKIEKQTSKVPSTTFLIAAVAAMGVSLAFQCVRKKHTSLFIGQWAAPFLLLGIYNKIVKVAGHDRGDN
ncbi:hypothetical protein [Chitinophaga sp.]|uniref:hypothetical protein n=1 Tax=Chitinophaga sp. TaxID=1869181 RepID=UPI0031CEB480